MRLHPIFDSTSGRASEMRRLDPVAAHAADRALDAALEAFDWDALKERHATPRRILVVIPAYPAAGAALRARADALASSSGRHRVSIVVDDRPDVPRLRKIGDALRRGFPADWLLVVDDDVALAPRFIDRFVAGVEAAGLDIAQPAHRLHSFASYAVTQRRAGSLVRRTNFVETGPAIAVRAGLLPHLLPLPDLRWGWGVDILWADMAKRMGWRLGVIDGTPMEHLRPIRFDIPARAPLWEANALLLRTKPSITRAEMLGGDSVSIPL